MSRDKKINDDSESINLGDLFTDSAATLDLSNLGGGGSMYDPYIYAGGTDDTITLTGLDSPWNNDLNVSGDIKVDGVSLKNWMENVNKRLAILEPKPELLEKYAALQKAYEHYKTLEALLHNADKINPPN